MKQAKLTAIVPMFPYTYIIDKVCAECNACFMGTRGGVKLATARGAAVSW